VSRFIINPYAFGVAGLTIAFQASATSTAATVTGPASIQAGDVLLLGDRARNTVGLPTAVIPTGFTEIASTASDGTTSRTRLSYKIADGSEASASITGMDGTSTDNKVLLVFRPSTPATVLTFADPGQETTDVNPTSQTITASGGAVPLIVGATYGSSAAVDPRSSTPAMDAEVSSSTLFYFGYKIYNSAPSDHTVDMDDEGATNTLQSFYVEVA
jgi:hypothetical protein